MNDPGVSVARAMVRQGDVLLVPVELDVSAGRLIARTRVVLAEGEATGHAHVVASPRARLLSVADRTVLVVTGKRPVDLDHEEHDSVPVAPGLWEVVRQREYRPEARSRAAWVAD